MPQHSRFQLKTELQSRPGHRVHLLVSHPIVHCLIHSSTFWIASNILKSLLLLTPAGISQRSYWRSDYSYGSRLLDYRIEPQRFPYINTSYARSPHRSLFRHGLLFDSSKYEELEELFFVKGQPNTGVSRAWSYYLHRR
jgi:hypothetical protein